MTFYPPFGINTPEEIGAADSSTVHLLLETSEKTADYTLALADANKIVLMNKTGAATLTVPTNAVVAFPIGTVVGVYNVSSDAVTIAGDVGVTVRNDGVYIEYIESNQRDWRTAKTLTITNPMYTSFGPVVVRVRKTNTANPVGVGVKYG